MALPIDVHLMIEEPEKYVELFAEQGADMISVHVEATPHIHRVIQQIKNANVQAGVVINPGTPIESIAPVLKMLDYIIVITVKHGVGVQSFIQVSLDKLNQLCNFKIKLNLTFEVIV